jgi:hypothetical protein
MRNLTIVFLIFGIITTIGCENIFNKTKTETVEPDNKALSADNEKTTFDKSEREGFNMTVMLDEAEAVPSKYVTGEKFWKVPPCKPAPTIFFQFDREILGDFKSATLTINPVVDGKIERTNVWEYVGEDKLEPDKKITLNKFNHYSDGGKSQKDIESLPVGKYIFNLRIEGSGTATWDGRAIEVEIK